MDSELPLYFSVFLLSELLSMIFKLRMQDVKSHLIIPCILCMNGKVIASGEFANIQ
jgi:hypothetical protein